MITKATIDKVEEVQEMFEEMVGEEIPLDEVEYRVEHAEESDNQDLYLYRKDNEPVGMLGVKIREDEAEDQKLGEVTVLVVKEDYRGNGYGKKMIDFAEDVAYDNDCNGIMLVSGFGKSAKAYQLYVDKGYTDQGSRLIKHF